VGLVHDLVTKLKVLRNHETVLEPYDSIGILSAAMSFFQFQSLVTVTHSSVYSLGGNDIFFDSWIESYIVQSVMWNNSETWFFRITT
jgi:hypothetical protein